jgi:hypothetical protein
MIKPKAQEVHFKNTDENNLNLQTQSIQDILLNSSTISECNKEFQKLNFVQNNEFYSNNGLSKTKEDKLQT